MQTSPEIRAVVKMVMFALSMLVAAAVTVFLLEVFGLAVMLKVLGAACLIFTLKMFYDIQVSQERYRDELARLQKTVRE